MNATGVKKTKKRRKWPIVVGAIAAILVVGFVVMPLLSPSMGAVSSAYQQDTVQKGSIINTVVGSGNLAYGDTVDVKIPTGVKMNEVLVEEGDHVQSGQVLATVDMASVQIRLADVQEQINDLDEEINSSKDDTEAEEIKSHVAGRVKIVNAQEGKEAADVILESGSLMTVSIDGKMAVDFEGGMGLSIGDDVDVVLSDGSEKNGTVARKTGSICTVTLTDNGPGVGEAVIVRDKDGNAAGEGTLYINSPIEIIGTGGVIEAVHVVENDSVSTGTRLVTLDGVAASAELVQLQSQRAELMETYSALVALSRSGEIAADRSGTVDAVNVTEGEAASVDTSASSDASTQSQSYAAQMGNMSASGSAGGGAFSMQLLSLDVAAPATGQSGALLQTASAATVEITELSDLALMPPAEGAVPQTAIDGSPAFSGTVQWLPGDAVFAADTPYTAAISLTANAGYQFGVGIVPAVDGAQVSNIAVSADSEGNTLTFSVTYPVTAGITGQLGGDAIQSQQPESGGMGDYSAAQGSGIYGGGSYSGSVADSGMSSGMASVDQSASAATANTSTSEAVAFSIATDEQMVLAVSIDELDILSISEGMDASVVFDAMESEAYEGTIVSVADAASSSSGVSKYTVEIHIPKDEKMRAGMNATATIVIEQLDGILTLPVDALQEREETVFVYTQMDAETGLPGGEVEVATGLSDGEFVEITSGLSEGDAVYYIMNTGDDNTMMMMFGGGMGGSAGGIGAGGGEMPFGG